MASERSLPSAPDEVLPGDVIADKYRFDRLLGEGAQGWVWQAQNLVLDVPVAIKIVRSAEADKTLPDRLFQEARAAARLGHPAIVRVFDLGQAWNGLPFLVMELLEGESLADRLVQSGRLSPELALRILLPIADALIAAHAKGIVHRDVKPDNVFLASNDGTLQPKLLDFGIAKVAAHPALPRQLTQSGAIVGSPAYLSPEQAQGFGIVDQRADVWSFCTTLYECLTGQVPFEGENWRTLRRQIAESDARSILSYGVGDEKLWRILERGLAKSAQARWPTMRALGRELALWLLERGVKEDVCGVSLESHWLGRSPSGSSLFTESAAEPTVLPRQRTAALPQRRSGQTARSHSSARTEGHGRGLAASIAVGIGIALGLVGLSTGWNQATDGPKNGTTEALALSVPTAPAPTADATSPSRGATGLAENAALATTRVVPGPPLDPGLELTVSEASTVQTEVRTSARPSSVAIAGYGGARAKRLRASKPAPEDTENARLAPVEDEPKSSRAGSMDLLNPY